MSSSHYVYRCTSSEGQYCTEDAPYCITGIKYAFDKSLAEAVLSDDSLPQAMSSIIELLKSTKQRAAFVLKPSLLGFKTSILLASLARVELGGSEQCLLQRFDSGVGLAFTSFMTSVSETVGGQETRTNPHKNISSQYFDILYTRNQYDNTST